MAEISFLMPAHNEEKIIAQALENLKPLASENIEVLVGLDGCTDNTKKVVQQYEFAKIFELNERGGKPAVLKRLMKEAKGEIIIVHDADWAFHSTKKGLEEIKKCFEDPKIGGIVLPPHNIPFLEMASGIKSFDFLGMGLGAFLMLEYLFKTQTKQVGESVFVDRKKIIYPFAVNIFRRGIIPDAETAADDFERFSYLLERNFEVAVFNNPNLPFFEVTYKEIDFRSHLRQRVKGHIARAQIKSRAKYRPSLSRFIVPFIFYVIKNIPRIGLKGFLAVSEFFMVWLLSSVEAKKQLSNGIPSAKKAWSYRFERKGIAKVD